ncbi:MAG: biopolymer transporter ExbD [Saprospiraceae bacterium]|jgi:biopolymer transport protein ExbD|nr:biopolymer transporter ExbD [Saprospiraceae bacterium]MBK8636410.1 biopolymer transporter ExbD [Saprospiraceae bacterium]MBP7644080.1 biopolymer transporter ExbD [Saprospiraceae bacterium]HOY14226.1 biopolymer transporter ExbD [Saprospiraceae bacterium]
MGLGGRNKITAEFNMSSLTDIIFLLLIFFMLTSSIVQINVPLPQSDSKTVAPSDLAVMLKKDESISFNGKPTTIEELEKVVATNLRYSENKENAVLSIISESGVTYDRLHEVMKIAAGLKIKAILATQPKDK